MAMVASPQPDGIWQNRTQSTFHGHIPQLSTPGFSYGPSMGQMQIPNGQRSYQMPPLTIPSPSYQSPNFASPSGFPPSPYRFDGFPVNSYGSQQHYDVGFSSTYSQESYQGSGVLTSAVEPATYGVASSERNPHIKTEPSSPSVSHHYLGDTGYSSQHEQPSIEADVRIDFKTEVDTLMKAIQANSPDDQESDYSEATPSPQMSPCRPSQRLKKKYECSVPGCQKRFYQKTHLDIHTRAHTGYKPFVCKEPTCGQRFSQLGNLKTHERRHTGERPYHCDICGKTFAQRGNLRPHKIVHQQVKPFTCRLDDCGKQFTQLGNLKSHQNKFHASTLRNLTQKFATIQAGDSVSSQDRELWEYFAQLYKNSNKGIKGRGKDRRISPSSSPRIMFPGPPGSEAGEAMYRQASGSIRSSSLSSESETLSHAGEDTSGTHYATTVTAPPPPPAQAPHNHSDYGRSLPQMQQDRFGSLVFAERKLF